MLLAKKFFPSVLTVFAVYNKFSNSATIYFTSPVVVFRLVLPRCQLIFFKNITTQLQCYLYSAKHISLNTVFFTKTFFNVLLNRIRYQGYVGLKTIGVGYHFVVSKESAYLFISAGLSHLIVHRLQQGTRVAVVKKKKRLLVLSSYKNGSLASECNFIRRLRPPDLYCGKGLRLFHEFYKLKEGKKQIR